jgi:biopolymer transport protein TolR
MAEARRRRLMSEINVVPYIDVMLVLLIIFMITAPLLTQGVKVELPKAQAEAISDQRLPLVISVDRAGRFFINIGGPADKPVDGAELGRRVSLVMQRDAATPVLIKADQGVPYGRVVQVLSLVNRAGAPRVGFVTDPEPLDNGRQ